MSAELAKMAKGRDKPRRDGLNAQEQTALKNLQAEAKAKDSVLATGGKGGLPPSMVLGRMRKDGYKCKVCGEPGTDDNGGLSIHHIGGIPESERTSAMGHRLTMNNLVTICETCHDRLHEDARKRGVDSSQITPAGDE